MGFGLWFIKDGEAFVLTVFQWVTIVFQCNDCGFQGEEEKRRKGWKSEGQWSSYKMNGRLPICSPVVGVMPPSKLVTLREAADPQIFEVELEFLHLGMYLSTDL